MESTVVTQVAAEAQRLVAHLAARRRWAEAMAAGSAAACQMAPTMALMMAPVRS